MAHPQEVFSNCETKGGTNHWVDVQGYHKDIYGNGQCFLLSLQFVDLLLGSDRGTLRLAQPYQNVFNSKENTKHRTRMQRAMNEATVGYRFRTLFENRQEKFPVAENAWRAVPMENEEARNAARANAYRPNHDHPMNEAGFEESIMRLTHGLHEAEKVTWYANDASTKPNEITEKVLKLLSRVCAIMVHLEGAVPHQLVIANHLVREETEFFDPNGGYSSFPRKADAANWFVTELIANTVYDTANVQLVQYVRS